MATRPDPLRGETVSLHHVWAELQPEDGPAGSHQNSARRRQAQLRLSRWEELQGPILRLSHTRTRRTGRYRASADEVDGEELQGRSSGEPELEETRVWIQNLQVSVYKRAFGSSWFQRFLTQHGATRTI